MNDFENFKTMLSHGFASNKNFLVKEFENGDKIIEKKRIHLSGLRQEVVYHQFIFGEDGEFITWQTSYESMIE